MYESTPGFLSLGITGAARAAVDREYERMSAQCAASDDLRLKEK
jgi:hypothetical protein